MSTLEQFIEIQSTPLKKDRASRVLTTNTLNKNRVIKRHELIEEKVKEGATVKEMSHYGRSIVSPDGAFIEEARITKIALDYAEYLLSGGM